MTLDERLRKFGEGEVDNVILSRADARYLADLIKRYRENEDGKDK